MAQEDLQKLMELLGNAPWADWAVTPNSIPKAQLKNAATPDSDAIQKAHECLNASKAVCVCACVKLQSFVQTGPE